MRWRPTTTRRLNLRQSLAWWLPVLVLLALGVWEYLLLADGAAMGHQHSGGGRMSGAVSGLVLAGGVLLVSTLIWLLPLAAFFDAPLTRHLSNAARLAVGRLGITALALVIATAPVAVLWTVPAMRTAALWFLVLIGPAFQTYLIALLQRSTVAGLAAAAPASS